MRNKIVKVTGVLTCGLVLAVGIAHSLPAEQTSAASFNEVWQVITQVPDTKDAQIERDIQKYGTVEQPQLPQFSSGPEVLAAAIFGFLKDAALRTVGSQDDYHDYFQKLVHANGICFAGAWTATEDSKYSGLFKKGSAALMIGRISAASPQTTNDKNRSFGFAGKLFPTTNPDQKVQTANFFTVDNLNGTPAKHVLDVAYTNEPPVDLSGFLNPLAKLNKEFAKADIHPEVRPVYPIARAGQMPTDAAVTPRWMRIRTAPGQQALKADDADFRNELSGRNYRNGITFLVDVSDTTKDAGSVDGWQNIGQIRASEMFASFGCDRRLHFHHSPFNDPAN